jgi:hypothetical protein
MNISIMVKMMYFRSDQQISIKNGGKKRIHDWKCSNKPHH